MNHLSGFIKDIAERWNSSFLIHITSQAAWKDVSIQKLFIRNKVKDKETSNKPKAKLPSLAHYGHCLTALWESMQPLGKFFDLLSLPSVYFSFWRTCALVCSQGNRKRCPGVLEVTAFQSSPTYRCWFICLFGRDVQIWVRPSPTAGCRVSDSFVEQHSGELGRQCQ